MPLLAASFPTYICGGINDFSDAEHTYDFLKKDHGGFEAPSGMLCATSTMHIQWHPMAQEGI